MKLNKTVHFEQSNSSSTPSVMESIVEIGTENGSHFTILNDCDDWEDDNDRLGLISTQNSFNLVSRLWTVYIVVVVLLMCILIYTFVRDGGATMKYDSTRGHDWTFDI